jgi:hypothetical protein
MTQEFDFYMDEKVVVWNRQKFSIEAENLDEAKAKVRSMIEEAEDFDPWDSEILYESMDALPVDKNDGKSTIIIFSDNASQVIYENGK